MSEKIDKNGCEDSGNPLRRVTVSAGKISAVRYSVASDDAGQTIALTKGEAFAVITQLTGTERSQLFKNGEPIAHRPLPKAALTIHDLADEWVQRFETAFDQVIFFISYARIKAFALGNGRLQFTRLSCEPGIVDEVARGIAQSLMLLTEKPEAVSQLLLEQLDLALLAHLAQNYGGVHFPIKKRGTLTAAQQHKATEFLTGHFNSQFSIAALCESCELSRSYFMKSFKETFGKTPHRWLTEYRVELAKEKLLSDISISDIAAFCGFADQSHLSRVFAEVTGVSPGAWRRQNRVVSPNAG